MWYQKYVYDQNSRTLIGRFEDLYREGVVTGLDAWHQDALDEREDVKLAQFALADITGDRRLSTVLDLGCGKGVLANYLFANAERYIGIDISDTAIATARASFPSLEFVQSNIQTGEDLSRVISECHATNFDLFFCSQTLSFMEDWKGILKQVAKSFEAAIIVLYLPPNPIGYIKSFENLVDEVGRNFSEIKSLFSPSKTHLAIGGRCAKADDVVTNN